MDNNNQKGLLILGKPASCKSTFLGQFYKRAQEGKSGLTIAEQPKNIEILNGISNRLAIGLQPEHTTSKNHEHIEFKINFKNQIWQIAYPDYAGEQITSIVKEKRIPLQWHSAIMNSDNWLLFIKVTDLKVELNPINHPVNPIKQHEEATNTEVKEEEIEAYSRQAFFIELLQIMLYVKQTGFIKKINTPSLIIAISSWDELTEPKLSSQPADLLQKEFPLFYNFINSIWDEDFLTILGVSPQGMALDTKKPNSEYIDTDEGYIVLENGQKEKDLTILIQKALGL